MSIKEEGQCSLRMGWGQTPDDSSRAPHILAFLLCPSCTWSSPLPDSALCCREAGPVTILISLASSPTNSYARSFVVFLLSYIYLAVKKTFLGCI